MGKPKVLVTTPYPLLPANSGGRIYALSTIVLLSRDMDYHLIALCNARERRELEEDQSNLLRKYHEVFKSIRFVERPTIPSELKSKYQGIRHFALHGGYGLPLMDVSYFSKEAIEAARVIVRNQRIDLMEMHHLHTAFFRRFFPSLPAVLVNHNLESELWPFWPKQNGSWVSRKIWSFFGQVSRKNAYQIEIENQYQFDAKFFVSPIDMSRVSPHGCPLHLLPMGVPLDSTPKCFREGTFRILWAGGLWWPPNSEAAIWFVEEIWPLVKGNYSGGAEVHFVGGDPPQSLLEAHDGREIFVHGFVPDIRPFYEKADAFVVPIHSGGGVRIKIIHALNAGIPVVTTSKGCQGLPVEHGKNVLVGDTAEAFAGFLLRLAETPDLRRELSRNGREYCLEHHHPEKIAQMKRKVFQAILKH
jgi:glycosyltransferase involved in cell wall biosynthesis